MAKVKNKNKNIKVDLSIIIVNYNTAKLTDKCIKSVLKNTKNIKFEITVIDNASTDESLKMLNKYSRKRNFELIRNKKNLGFSKANNQGIKIAKGNYILLLNSDTEFSDSFLDKIVTELEDSNDIGIATCALKNLDQSLQVTGGYFPNLVNVFAWMTIQDLPLVDRIIKPFHPKRAAQDSRELDWVTGAFFLINKQVIDQIGDLDEDYFMYTEEVDFCFRAKKAGWKVLYLPKWSILHLGGASSIKEFAVLQETKGIKLFFKKHYPKWHLPILRLFLKIGFFWRMFLVSPKIYWKAFKVA